MKRTVTMLLAILTPAFCAFAQGEPQPPSPAAAAPVITLQQTIDAALANGDDNLLLQASLDLGKSQHEENVSRNSWGLSGSAAAGYNLPAGNPGVLAAKQSSLSTVSSASQGAQVGIGLGGPQTSISVTAAPWTPPVQPIGTAPPGDTFTSVGVSVSQTIWNGYPGGPTQATVDKSLLALRSRILSTDSGRLNIVFRVKQAYFALLAAQQNAAVTRQILDKQNALLGQISAIYKLRQASDVDLKTAQINAHSAEVDVQNADHVLRIARIQLAILMGRPTDAEFTVAPPDPQGLPAATLADAIAQAMSRRVDFAQLELNRKSNAVDLSLARGQATPSVSIVGGFAQYFDWTGQSAWLANAGVKVSMPILDAGAAGNLVDAAVKQDQIYTLQQRQLQKSIAVTIQNDWETVQIQNERVEVARMTAENDDLLVEVYRIQNQNGAASAQDLLTASVNAAGARTAYVQAQSNAQLAVLQLLSDMGY